MTLYIRTPTAPADRRFWYARFWGPDPARPGHTKAMLWCTKQLIKAQAEKVARAHVAAIHAGQLGGKTRAAAEATIAEILPLYRQHSDCKPATVRANLNCLLLLLRTAGQASPEAVPLSALGADLLRRWRVAIADSLDENDDPHAEARTYRSANSLLRQARSVFTPALREHYEAAGLELPPGLLDFCTRPGFSVPTKRDYNKPDDLTLTRTFASLAEKQAADRNLYLAIWLALGFGMRKSEIAAARVGWFLQINGRICCRMQHVTKNGAEDVTIECQNGAWEKLAPLLNGRNTSEYVLAGTDAERTDDVFRRVSAWMRDLGWATQKTMHEWRAYAGCSVAENKECGLAYASQWLRHGSIELTQRAYGRYIRQKNAPDVPLSLPAVQPVGEFKPQIAAG